MRKQAFEIAAEWVRYGAMDQRGAFDALRAGDAWPVASAREVINEAATLFEFGMAIMSAARRGSDEDES